jgi:thioester reductase-like protein
MIMPKTFLLTGVTGFLGQELLHLLARDDNNRVYCLLRDRKKESAAQRFGQALKEVGLAGRPGIELVAGDLRRERMGLSESDYDLLSHTVTNVIHAAADVRFNQPLEAIRANNAGGTARILEFTDHCRRHNPAFSHLDYVSTAFVAGRRPGLSLENALLNGAGFKNTYEQTKFEAEGLARARRSDLPIIIYRPSIVLGLAGDGRAKSRNVIYPMLKLFRKWKMPVISARSATRLDLVPVDFVAQALLHISGDPHNLGKCFHLAAGPDGDVSLGQLIDIMGEEFGQRVIVMPPGFWKYVVRPLLKTFRRDFYERSTGVFRAFEPYIWEPNARYAVEETRQALRGSGLELPDTDRFLRACFRYALASDFGSKESPGKNSP